MPVLPEYDLSGKVAILATSGGDEAPQLALALAEAGATVFAVARRESSLESRAPRRWARRWSRRGRPAD